MQTLTQINLPQLQAFSPVDASVEAHLGSQSETELVRTSDQLTSQRELGVSQNVRPLHAWCPLASLLQPSQRVPLSSDQLPQEISLLCVPIFATQLPFGMVQPIPLSLESPKPHFSVLFRPPQNGWFSQEVSLEHLKVFFLKKTHPMVKHCFEAEKHATTARQSLSSTCSQAKNCWPRLALTAPSSSTAT